MPTGEHECNMNETAAIGINTEQAEEKLVSRVPVIRETAAFWLRGCTRCGGNLGHGRNLRAVHAMRLLPILFRWVFPILVD